MIGSASLAGSEGPLVAPVARSLPHDVAAEQSVLGALLYDSDSIALVREKLQPADFYAERNANIYRAAVSLADRGEPIDEVTLRAQLERTGQLGRSGGIDYLTELLTVVPTAANIGFYAKIVQEHAMRRRLIQAGGEVARLGYDTTLPADEAMDQAEQRVFAISEERRDGEAVHVTTSVLETWAHLETLQSSHRLISGVPTNFRSLDQVTLGLQPGELIILAARPSVGKTSFALNVARNAAVVARKPVLIHSLEMTRDSLMQRLICSEAAVDAWLLKTGQADSDAYRRIAKAMDGLMKCDMWIDDSQGLTIETLRSRVRRMRAQHGIDLVVIDYLQLMHGGRRQDSRVQEVSDISAGLKSIAKELKIPVLALSQLSRESERRESRRPQLSDLRDSGAIEQDADVVLFLYRQGMHDENVDRSQTKLIVAKNRNGPVRDIDLIFNAEQTSFREPHLAAGE